MKKTYDILVAGELNPDIILSDPDLEPEFGQVETLVDDAVMTIGSSNAIFACGAAHLGLKVGFISVVGKDLFGEFMLDQLELRGVDISNVRVDPTLTTGSSIILNRGEDRAILTHIGTIDAVTPLDITPELLTSTRHLHIASYFLQTKLQPGLPDLFRQASMSGITTSLDTNWDPSANWTNVRPLLPLTTIFLPNEKEIISISGAETVEAAIGPLAEKINVVAVKRGPDGATAQSGDELVSVPAYPVQIVDTVGAGDSFDAGFLYGFLNGWSLERTLRLAVICGSLSASASGGTAGQPTMEEAMRVYDHF